MSAAAKSFSKAPHDSNTSWWRAAIRGKRPSESREFVLHRARGRLDRLLDFGHLTTHVLAEYLDEHANERVRAGVDVRVRVSLLVEESAFVFPRRRHVRLRVDVELRSVHHRAPAVFETQSAPLENVSRVRASIHEVEFGEHADGSLEVRVDFSRDANAVGGGDVGVGGTYGDDDDVRGRDEGFRHLLDVADDGYGLIEEQP